MAQSKSNKGKVKRSSGRNSQTSRRRRSAGRSTRRPGRGDEAGQNRRRSSNRGLGGQQVEGRQAVRELLIAGTRGVTEITVNEDLEQTGIVEDVLHLAHELRVPVKFVARRRIDAEATTESHQGMIAKAAPLKEHSLDSLLSVPNAFLLVLDGITDPRNLGAMLRIAECAGVTGVVMGRHRAVHVTPAATKTAAGAIEYLPMCLVGGIPTAISDMKKAQVATIGLDGSGTTSIFDQSLEVVESVALVMGAEGAGMSKLVKQRVDVVASIPLAGQLASLNVATAASVACYEIVRRRNSEISIG